MLRIKPLASMVLLALTATSPVLHAAASSRAAPHAKDARLASADTAASATANADAPLADASAAAASGKTKTLEAVTVTGHSVAFTNNELPPVLLNFSAPLTSVLDVVNLLPGVNVTPGGVFDSDDWSMGVTMRGFTQDQLGFTIDGLPNGATSYGGGAKPNRFLDPENLRTVTISQGTSDISSPSAQALGGTLNYESIDPSNTRNVRIAYSTGSWQAQKEFVRYDTGGIFDDSTVAYLSFSNTYNKRWIGDGTNGHSSRVHIDAKSITNLSDALTMTARLSWDDAYENNYNSITLAQFAQDPNWDRLNWNWTGQPYIDQNFVEPWNTVRKNALAGVRFDYQPSNATSYTFYPYFAFMEGSGGWLPPYQLYATDGNGQITGNRPAPGAAFGYDFFQTPAGQPIPVPTGCANPFDASCYPAGSIPASSFRQSLYKNQRYGFIAKGNWQIGINNLSAGMWFENLDRFNGRVWYAVIDPRYYWNYTRPPYYMQFYQQLRTDTRKLYAQDVLRFGPLELSAGVSKYLVSLTGNNLIGGGAQFASLGSDSNLLPSLGAVYDLDRANQLYASVTKNFAAVPDGVIQAAAAGSDISHVLPESSVNIDAGWRFNARDMQASLALYHVRFANQIVFLTPGSSGLTQINYTIGVSGSYLNVGGITAKGVEGILNWRATPTLDLYASGTYNDSTYIGNVNGIVAGNKVAGQPGRMLALAANYHSGGMRAGLSAKYVGDRYGNLANSERLPSYVTADAYVGYHLDFGAQQAIKSADIGLTVTNLLNRRYLGTVDSAGTPGYYFIAPPRTTIFTVSANF
jgi:iron complex outermembrane receptor protein